MILLAFSAEKFTISLLGAFSAGLLVVAIGISQSYRKVIEKNEALSKRNARLEALNRNHGPLSGHLASFGLLGLNRAAIWFPETESQGIENQIVHIALGNVEEAGEVTGVIKKWHRMGGKLADLNREKLHGEMVDELIYLSQLAVVTGMDWDKTIDRIITSNVHRFGTLPDRLLPVSLQKHPF